MKTYKGFITKLLPHQIFVFGSNTQGRHGKGAALWALKNAGATYGQARGRQGQSYAIVTKDLTKRVHPSRSPVNMVSEITALYRYAVHHPELEFLIPYNVNYNPLNGWSVKELAMFFSSILFTGYCQIPDNIVFEEGFAELVKGS
jgi:hypothetical protein